MMGDTPDKRRPWVMRHCPYCDFQSDAEWAWLRHMEEAGHPFPVLGGCYALGPDCDGPMHLHHIVKQQRIRAEWRSLMAAKRRGGPKPWSVTKALADERNLVETCQRHHKEDTPMPLPPGFWAFVEEYGLQGCLPRYLAEQEAA